MKKEGNGVNQSLFYRGFYNGIKKRWRNNYVYIHDRILKERHKGMDGWMSVIYLNKLP